MPLDWTYQLGDRVLDASGGNYETTDGCWPKVIREMMSDQVTKDGEVYGNPAAARARRGQLDAAEVEVQRKGLEQVGLRYQRAGLIKDLSVTSELGSSRTTGAFAVSLLDLQLGSDDQAVSVRVVPPWLT